MAETGQPAPDAARYRAVRRVLWATFAVNVVLAALKIGLGIRANSLSVLSDGFHSLLDGGANVVALVAITLASRPPDENHPYGHGKYEALATLALSGLLILTSWEILKTALARLWQPVELPRFEWLTLAALGGTVVANLFVSWWEQREGRRLRSSLLAADSVHTRTDVFTSVLAAGALLSARFGWFWLDPVAALAIVALILHAAWGMLRETVLTLSDAAQLNPEDVRACVMRVEGVRGAHDIRTHGMPHDIHVDLHLELPGDISSRDAFDLEERVMAALRREFPGITHVGVRHEPEPDGAQGHGGSFRAG